MVNIKSRVILPIIAPVFVTSPISAPMHVFSVLCTASMFYIRLRLIPRVPVYTSVLKITLFHITPAFVSDLCSGVGAVCLEFSFFKRGLVVFKNSVPNSSKSLQRAKVSSRRQPWLCVT